MREIVSDGYIESVASHYPDGRVGQPGDLVALATFLCRDPASHPATMRTRCDAWWC